ncbi:hypothetical protein caldi_08930 [Caldinitratiruptor microaerophilus]|uniref:Uncharacterized protein n=1 Tax=Caldinitratiruptor microaerophilus TaxID=671077 RepID=A0AA35CK09_9FIRM|nr:hypothetical protein caldi_08930 [Caldinitratiruptor microaerophilus]
MGGPLRVGLRKLQVSSCLVFKGQGIRKNTFQSREPKQVMLLPPSLGEWLPANHVTRFIDDVTASVGLSPITQGYEGEQRG